MVILETSQFQFRFYSLVVVELVRLLLFDFMQWICHWFLLFFLLTFHESQQKSTDFKRMKREKRVQVISKTFICNHDIKCTASFALIFFHFTALELTYVCLCVGYVFITNAMHLISCCCLCFIFDSLRFCACKMLAKCKLTHSRTTCD